MITGFSPFDEREVNGAQTLARALGDKLRRALPMQVCYLKVSWDSVDYFCHRTLPALNPQMVLCLGEADRTSICFETIGTGLCEGEDVIGNAPPPSNDDCLSLPHSREQKTREQKTPDQDTQDIRAQKLMMQAAWFEHHTVDVAISSDAGKYLCNRLLYLGMQHCVVPFGFVHVPIQAQISDTDYVDKYCAAIETLIQKNLT